jgi:hypothetical protein
LKITGRGNLWKNSQRYFSPPCPEKFKIIAFLKKTNPQDTKLICSEKKY